MAFIEPMHLNKPNITYLLTHQRQKRNRSQHPTNDYENQRQKKTKLHKEMEPGKQGRVEGIQQKSNRKRKCPPYRTRTLRRSRKANKNPPETNNRREANQNRQSKKNQQQQKKETQDRKEKSQKKFPEACKDQNNPKKVETKNTYMESQKKLREAIENEESRKIEAKLPRTIEESKNKPQHHLGNTEASWRMQWPRLQHCRWERKTYNKPPGNQSPHSRLLWRPIPSPWRNRGIQGMDT